MGVSNPVGAGGQIIGFKMQSQCVRGQKWTVNGTALMGSAWLGKLPISQTNTVANFEDGLDYESIYFSRFGINLCHIEWLSRIWLVCICKASVRRRNSRCERFSIRSRSDFNSGSNGVRKDR